MKKQMEDDIIARDRFERIFSGFAYEDGGSVKYYLDAEQSTVEAKNEYLKSTGKTVTPIYHKSYYFRAITEFSKLRQQFLADLRTVIDEQVWTDTCYLQKLPSVIDRSVYQALKEEVEQQSSPQALKNFIAYGHRWLVE